MALALFDYLPVVLALLGLLLVAQLLGRALPSSRAFLLAGVALVVLGGLGKATWKLIWVVAQEDIVLLDGMLFVCMAPGMVLLACHAFAAESHWRSAAARANPARNSLVIIAVLAICVGLAAALTETRAWFLLLLAATAASNILMTAVLILLSWRWGQRLTAAIFLFSILITLSLSGLAPLAAESASMQWLEEALNVLGQGGFALAAWRLLPVAPSAAVASSSAREVKA